MNKSNVRFSLENKGNQFGSDGIQTTPMELAAIPLIGQQVCLSEDQRNELINKVEEMPEDQRSAAYNAYWNGGQFNADLEIMRVANVRHWPETGHVDIELSLIGHSQTNRQATNRPAFAGAENQEGQTNVNQGRSGNTNSGAQSQR